MRTMHRRTIAGREVSAIGLGAMPMSLEGRITMRRTYRTGWLRSGTSAEFSYSKLSESSICRAK